MRRIVGLAGVGVLLVIAMVVAATGAASGSGGHDQGKGKTIRVVERATTDTSVDLGATGDSIGDLLAFGNELFDQGNQIKVGTDQGSCVRTVLGKAYECTWTNSLAKGQITVQGPVLDSATACSRSPAAPAPTAGPAARWISTPAARRSSTSRST